MWVKGFILLRKVDVIMINFNKLTNDMIVSHVKDLFLYTFSPLIKGEKLTQETVNTYFKVIFDSPELVTILRNSFDSANTMVDFRGVEYTTEEVETFDAMLDEFVSIKFHSMHDDFTLFVKEELEPRDMTYYVTLMFKPHENVYNTI